MIFQTTKGLHSDLKIWGCYFLSILRIFEKIARIEFKVDDVNQIYKLCRKLGYVGPEAYILEGAIKGISQIASAVMIENIYMCLVNSQGNYNNILAKWTRLLPNDKYNTHFTLQESAKVLEYDPYSDRGSKTVREGKIIDYRYIFSERI